MVPQDIKGALRGKKIAIIAPSVFALNESLNYGGAERFLLQFCPEMAVAFEEHGLEKLTVIAPSHSKLPGCEVIETRTAPQVWANEELEAYAYYTDELKGFDLVHDCSHQRYSYLQPSGKRIATLMGIQTSILPKEAKVFRWPKINAVSLSVFHVAKTRADFGIDSLAIPLGINLDRYPAPTDDIPRKDFMLCFGLVAPHKGVLEAIRMCQDAMLDLVIAGEDVFVPDAQYVNQVKAAVKKAEFPQVNYLGSISENKKRQLFGEARGLLFCSLFEEAWSMLMMEANACGLPIYTYRRGAFPEMVKDGINGCFLDELEGAGTFTLRDMLLPLTGTNQFCRSYTETNFNVKNVVKQYLELYADVVGGKTW